MNGDGPTIWLAAGLRTPFARVDGPLQGLDVLGLSVPVVQAMARAASGPIDLAVWGAVVGNLAYSNLAREVWLEAGLDPIQELSVPRVFSHVNHYLDALEPALVDRGFLSLRSSEPEQRSGILSTLPPRGIKASDLVQALRKRRVIASMPDGLLRFAPHFPNSLDEVPAVLAALDASLEELSKA